MMEVFYGLVLLAVIAFYAIIVPGIAIGGFMKVRRLEALMASMAETPAPEVPEAWAPSLPAHETLRRAPEPQSASELAHPPSSKVPISRRSPSVGQGEQVASRQIEDSKASFWASLESLMGARLAIWVGALSVFLGGVFLVKYAADNGMLSPMIRMVVGIALGVFLAGFGEMLRTTRPTLIANAPDSFAIGVSGVGLGLIYASLYAGYVFHALISPGLAFVAMAATALAGLSLALRQGRWVAFVSLAGAFAVPALIPSDSPTLTLFTLYLLFVTSGGVAVGRRLGSSPVAQSACGGALVWLAVLPLSLLNSALVDIQVLGPLLLLSVIPVFAAVGAGFSWITEATFRDGRGGVFAMSAAVALLGVLYLWRLGPVAPVLAGLVAIGVVQASMAIAQPALDRLISIVSTLSVASFGIVAWINLNGASLLLNYWDVSVLIPPLFEAGLFDRELWGWTFALSITFFTLGIGMLWRGRPSEGAGMVWALSAAFTPFSLFAILHLTSVPLFAASLWACLFTGLASIYMIAAIRLYAVPERWLASHIFAFLSVSSLVYGLASSLGSAAFTMSLCVMFVGLLYVRRVPGVPGVTLALASVGLLIIGRLVIVHIGSDGALWGGSSPVRILATFGSASLATLFAVYWFRQQQSFQAVRRLFLEATFMLIALTASLLVRDYFAAPDLAAKPSIGFVEVACHILFWLCLALAILRLQRRSTVVYAGPKWLIGLSLAGLGILQICVHSPLVPGAAVLGGIWVNTLALGYLAPALLLMTCFLQSGVKVTSDLDRATVWASGGIALVYLTLQTRFLFQGSMIGIDQFTTDAEWYAHSAVWLIAGGIALFSGVKWQCPKARHAGLSLLTLVVIKAFLWDMSMLTGLLRALSFLGLGGSLLAIGYLYQRVIPRWVQNTEKEDRKN